MKNLLRISMLAAILAVAMQGCDLIDSNEPSFASFTFTGQKGKSKINAKKRTVEAEAEVTVDLGAIKPNFNLSPSGTEATVDGEQQISGATTQSFWEPVKYLLTNTSGDAADWTVTITYPDGNDSGGKGGEKEFKPTLKAGKIFYNQSNGYTGRLCFDDYGKKWRYEEIYSEGDFSITYYVGGKDCYMYRKDMNWQTTDIGDPTNFRWPLIPFDDQILSFETAVKAGIATKKTVTIAGQTCTQYVLAGTLTAAAWKNTVFLRFSAEDQGFEATSAREGCPANAFTHTINIAW